MAVQTAFSRWVTSNRYSLERTERRILGAMVLAALIGWTIEYGFYASANLVAVIDAGLHVVLGVFGAVTVLRVYRSWISDERHRRWWRSLIPFGLAALLLTLRMAHALDLDDPRVRLVLYRDSALVLFVLFELTTSSFRLFRLQLNPALLFISSFLIIILLGTFLLMLPRSQAQPIGLLDALFTSVSATCVTGLTVVSTEHAFTAFGQGVIMLLFQLGGLGVITFTYFFGFFFQGSASLKSTIAVKSMISADNIGSTLRLLLRIVLITLGVELLGAIALWFASEGHHHDTWGQHLGYVAFHAISAFCNAGFATEDAGLATSALAKNYPFQLIIIVLVVIGGIGFPNLINLGRFIGYNVRQVALALLPGRERMHKARLVRLNSILAINVTGVLLLVGFGALLLLEFNGVLQEHATWWGKTVTALFGAVTPRTAGFNTFDFADLTTPALLLIILLMWIGASPGSTGGGIKTTTLGVVMLTIWNVGRGRERLEYRRRQISHTTVQRATAVMMLSLLLIFLAILLLSLTDGHLGARGLVFEAVSAVSTVGLSLGITPQLSDPGKIIVAVCMLLGRVGMLTVLAAIIQQTGSPRYTYPEEDIQVG